MLERFESIFNLAEMPRVFLHGNPQVDSFAKVSAVDTALCCGA